MARGRGKRLVRWLNQETAGSREEGIDMEAWLSRPGQHVTREEAYELLKKYHKEVYTDLVTRRSPFQLFFYALFLALTFPVRWLWKVSARRLLEYSDRNREDLDDR